MPNPLRRAANATKASTAAVRSPYAAGAAKAAGNPGATTPFTRNASPINRKLCKRSVLLLSVSCANPLNPSLAIGGTADIDGYGRLGRLGLDANDVCLSAFSFSLVG